VTHYSFLGVHMVNFHILTFNEERILGKVIFSYVSNFKHFVSFKKLRFFLCYVTLIFFMFVFFNYENRLHHSRVEDSSSGDAQQLG